MGINGLVLFAIERRVGSIDTRGERNMSDALDDGEKIGDRIEAEMTLAKLATPNDLGRQLVGVVAGFESEVNALADTKLASGMDKRFPSVGVSRNLACE